MRLIDADALKHYMALTDDGHGVCYVPSKDIRRAPTIDAVPVVRCKDCKYYEIHRPKVLENCERNGHLIPMSPDDFCSYGERRSDD